MRPSWVPLAPDTPFPLENLPLGAFARGGDPVPHLGVAIGASIFDLSVAAERGLFDETLPGARALLCETSWNAAFARGRSAVRSIRERVAALLGPAQSAVAGDPALLVAQSAARMVLPVVPGDYVDFYASIAHATRVGRLFRPGEPPLPEAYRHLPIGYHGRASSIVPTGTAIVRPRGQVRRGGEIVFAPSAMLDFELELAYVTADGPALGTPIPIAAAREAIVGVALLNDWSARDIQNFEYRPLGPFLGKSFATSLGPWIVTLDALEAYRTPGPEQSPPPLPHLREAQPRADGVRCEIALLTAAMRAAGEQERVIARPRAAELYWSAAQMLAHLTSNGARVRAGDVFATGTISSGPAEPDAPSQETFEPGSLLERTPAGVAYLADGDEIVLRASCGGEDAARPRIGFGELRGRIAPAIASGG